MAVALDVEIRLLRPADAPQVAELLAAAFAAEFEGSGLGAEALMRQLRTGGWAQRGLLRRLAPVLGVEFAFFVAVRRGRVVGCTGVMGRRLPVVNSVAVLPEFRRMGIAEALVRAAETFAVECGHDAVVLDVLAHNTPAHTLYHKLGYEEYHRYRVYADPCAAGAGGEVGADGGGAALPAGYRLESVRGRHAAAFEAVERASLPERLRAVMPSLRPRYTGGPPAVVERLLAGARPCRRVLTRDGAVAGFLAAHLGAGMREARIDYPLVPAEHTRALAGALAEVARCIRRQGGASVRVDLSEDRPDQHTVAESLGLRHRWTFVQMVKRPVRGLRIPMRAAGCADARLSSA